MRILVGCLLLGLTVAPLSAQDKQAEAEAARFFERTIRPILVERCYRCHSHEAEKPKSGLYLDSRAGMLQGGELGPALQPGKPGESRLIEAIEYTDAELRMPPDKKLPDKTIEDFKRWIRMGAPWPGGGNAPPPQEEAESDEPAQITAEDRSYWAYQPIERPSVPKVENKQWIGNPIDAFILARLEEADLQPNKPANRRVLSRRAYYNLIGLPPGPAEARAFLNDDSAGAWKRLIADLLSRPQYGEKWGRHWLDVVRYAQTNGYERDGKKPNSWRYRDYVIRSFNEDKPFDRFIVEQLAGDELPEPSRDAIIATGFYRLGLWQDEPVDFEQNYYEQLDDIVRTTSEAFLGTTLGCARCHDHQADPFLQADYYRLVSFFHGIEPYSRSRNTRSKFNQTEITPPEVRRQRKEIERQIAEVSETIRKIEEAGLKKMPEKDRQAARKNKKRRQKLIKQKLEKHLTEEQQERYRQLKQRRSELEKRKQEFPREFALSVNNCRADPPATHVLSRGNADAKGERVEPRFPEVLASTEPQIESPEDGESTGRRLALARWIASEKNPLTARVIVNRLWQHHFGRGIVATPNDFGRLGTSPTHPKLLDWLAAELIAHDWRLKPMHKLIMTSHAYRMSSVPNRRGEAEDPANDLFWRFNMRRLSAEEIRDAILAANGRLNLEMGGPSIFTRIPDAVRQTASRPNQAWGSSPPSQRVRRSVYIFIKRSLVEPILDTFDYPTPDTSTGARFVTTVPTQSLTTLNGGFFNREAAHFAERLRGEAGKDRAEQVRRAFWLALSREPEPAELQRCLDLMQAWQQQDGLSREQALESFCLLMYNLNEFMYVD